MAQRKYTITIDKDIKIVNGWENNLNDIKPLVLIIFEGICEEKEARKFFQDAIQIQKSELNIKVKSPQFNIKNPSNMITELIKMRQSYDLFVASSMGAFYSM